MTAGANAGTATVTVRADLSDLDKDLTKLRSQFTQFGESLTNVTTAAGALGLALTAPFIDAVRSTLPFIQTLQEVKAVTNATESQFEALRQKAIEVGETTLFTAREAGEGLKFLAQAGFSAEEAIAAIVPATNFARASFQGLGRAAEGLINVTNALGLSIDKDLVKVSDVLVNTANSSAQSVTQLQEAFKFAGPAAKGAGISIEETAAVLGVLADAGLKAGKGGRPLVQFLQSLAKESTRNELAKLGVTVVNSSGGFRKIADIVADLQTKIRGLGKVEQADLFRRLFNTRGARVAIALLEQGTVKARALQRANESAGGTTQRNADIARQGLTAQIELLNATIEAVKTKVTDALTPVLTEIIKFIRPVIKSIGDWIAENPKLTTSVAALGVLLLAFAGTIGVIALAFKGIAGVIGVFAKGFGLLGGAAAKLGTIFPGLRSTFAIFATDFKQFGLLVKGGQAGAAIEKLGVIIKSFRTIIGKSLVARFGAAGIAAAALWNVFEKGFNFLKDRKELQELEEDNKSLAKTVDANNTKIRQLYQEKPAGLAEARAEIQANIKRLLSFGNTAEEVKKKLEDAAKANTEVFKKITKNIQEGSNTGFDQLNLIRKNQELRNSVKATKQLLDEDVLNLRNAEKQKTQITKEESDKRFSILQNARRKINSFQQGAVEDERSRAQQRTEDLFRRGLEVRVGQDRRQAFESGGAVDSAIRDNTELYNQARARLLAATRRADAAVVAAQERAKQRLEKAGLKPADVTKGIAEAAKRVESSRSGLLKQLRDSVDLYAERVAFAEDLRDRTSDAFGPPELSKPEKEQLQPPTTQDSVARFGFELEGTNFAQEFKAIPQKQLEEQQLQTGILEQIQLNTERSNVATIAQG